MHGSLDDRKKTEHLLALDGANERLHLFKVEMLDEGSFDSAVEGCMGVFHTASPSYLDVKDPQAEMIDLAVKGTLNVLRSCAKVPSIKKILFSVRNKSFGMCSKTLAEKAAWKFAEENGAQTFQNSTFRWIDVTDVSNAHILAFENPLACGRYCIAGKPLQFSEILKNLRQLYPSLNLPEKCLDEEQSMPAFPTFQVSQERVKSLGVTFTPLEVSLKDTIERLKERNFF
ncbi:3-beta hydroxysteroid dehydrogenase/isomerase [Corchorus capsularis]|uniref:3-beta hydroxysteroid dehydrogenase/isomerase n=1 Tax=Corchorus capsularis TaxID=210143 RepID=A0A1R3HN73_COCAP|nr:3-beta hydroxysteroid dehydrogenase/isomerase [Corchorus capsularis]